MNPRPPAGGSESGQGIDVLTGGTDVHLALVDLRGLRPEPQRQAGRGPAARDRDNRQSQRRALRPAPTDEASGLRVGTPALATRGLQREDFEEVGQIIAAALLTPDFQRDAGELSGRVGAIVERYPLYESLPV